MEEGDNAKTVCRPAGLASHSITCHMALCSTALLKYSINEGRVIEQ